MLGAIVGIPLGYAMGLSNWFRGWFDPIVEFMRPVPPLALIPLGDHLGRYRRGRQDYPAVPCCPLDHGHRVRDLACLASRSPRCMLHTHWARQRANHAPCYHSQLAARDFTAARVAMGVCWGTVVAAELVAAEKVRHDDHGGVQVSNTDIVLMGIILIGIIGFGIDMLMRWAERILVPWKGKG